MQSTALYWILDRGREEGIAMKDIIGTADKIWKWTRELDNSIVSGLNFLILMIIFLSIWENVNVLNPSKYILKYLGQSYATILMFK